LVKVKEKLNQQLHNEQHKMKPSTNAQFSFTVLKTICSSIQPCTPEDGHIDDRNM